MVVGVLVWSGGRMTFPHVRPRLSIYSHQLWSSRTARVHDAAADFLFVILQLQQPSVQCLSQSIFVVCICWDSKPAASWVLIHVLHVGVWGVERAWLQLLDTLNWCWFIARRWSSPVVRPQRGCSCSSGPDNSQHVHSVSQGLQSILEPLWRDDIIVLKNVSRALFTSWILPPCSRLTAVFGPGLFVLCSGRAWMCLSCHHSVYRGERTTNVLSSAWIRLIWIWFTRSTEQSPAGQSFPARWHMPLTVGRLRLHDYM